MQFPSWSQWFMRSERVRAPFGRHARWAALVVLALTLGLGILGPGRLVGYYPTPISAKPPFDAEASMLGLDYSSKPLSEWINGKKTLIFFFLPTCSHCQDAAPTVAKLAQKYGSKLQIIGVASGRSRLVEMREFQERFGLEFPILQDTSTQFAQKNGVKGTPAWFLTDGVVTNGKRAPAQSFSSFSPEMEGVIEVAIARLLGENPLPLLDPTRYNGSMVCSSCHREEYVSWSLNHHAVAMNSLVKSGKHEDPACIGCHVVGYQKKTGYIDFKSSIHLANVGCEACHGMAGGHNLPMSVEEKLKRSAQTADQKYKDTCVQCHDAKHTIGFSFEKGLPLVGHRQDRTLSEVDWLAKRTKLVNGEVDKPLLEFPPGKLQGAQSCAGCHPGIHATWKADPHGNAMASLKKAGKDQDLSCVPCHGTLREGAKADVLASWEAGVGCERCHGPAEAHVKAGGGRGNIVALTESCPVCVIDSICSSCHTKEQDPDFVLDEALERVRASHRAAKKGGAGTQAPKSPATGAPGGLKRASNEGMVD